MLYMYVLYYLPDRQTNLFQIIFSYNTFQRLFMYSSYKNRIWIVIPWHYFLFGWLFGMTSAQISFIFVWPLTLCTTKITTKHNMQYFIQYRLLLYVFSTISKIAKWLIAAGQMKPKKIREQWENRNKLNGLR